MMKERVLRYLRAKESPELSFMIDRCEKEIEDVALPKFKFKEVALADLPFEVTPYKNIFKDAKKYLLVVGTLGHKVDELIRSYSSDEISHGVVFDAVASVYIEEWLDNQQNLLQRNLGLRYCPGYGILPLSDNRKIADLLEAWRIGVHVTSSDAISPQKTIIGVCPIEEEI
jgi:hypothetical protein